MAVQIAFGPMGAKPDLQRFHFGTHKMSPQKDSTTMSAIRVSAPAIGSPGLLLILLFGSRTTLSDGLSFSASCVMYPYPTTSAPLRPANRAALLFADAHRGCGV